MKRALSIGVLLFSIFCAAQEPWKAVAVSPTAIWSLRGVHRHVVSSRHVISADALREDKDGARTQYRVSVLSDHCLRDTGEVMLTGPNGAVEITPFHVVRQTTAAHIAAALCKEGRS